MNQIKKLAEAELTIMNAIWEMKKPVSVRDILERLYPNGEKAYTTVQTIMNILFDKGFLRRDKVGLVNFYFPTVSRETFAEEQTATFVSKLFQGSFGALANYLVASGELSSTDLQKLKSMIEEQEQKERGES